MHGKKPKLGTSPKKIFLAGGAVDIVPYFWYILEMSEEKRKTAVFFKTLRGDEPVFDYLESIDDGESGRLYGLIKELELYGRLTEPHGKKLSSVIYEIRSGRHRILYAYDDGGVVLLHAFRKKRQKTDPDDIDLAEKRFRQMKGKQNA